MPTVEIKAFKMPFDTKTFRRGQTVWVSAQSGNEAALCVGKFKNKGRFVKSWVNWRSKSKEKPIFKTHEIDIANPIVKKCFEGDEPCSQ